ncbi:SCP2 sterol-binding domain-containing protein [Geomicrobium sp. JCM 19055]|uniref:SCP2 sterol-binding domain-containing protein n=1 Tax=Geomicrobium sp. JCM 19055 TaxID=1460649 RepID=UPI00045EDC62|nr:SCP2 sterol-binding domain-containing protein [Geomicrobium sp. JCM 19055]GAJ99470.1 hypothetical protein JCM19055_2472 [Geomicrobium sp. JCM 19055]
MATEEKIQQLANQMNENPKHIEDLERRYHFELKTEGLYGIVFKDGVVEVESNPVPGEADCVLKMSDKNFHKLLDGEWNPTTAYMTGQLKVEGEISHALKLYHTLKQYQ